ncbi:Homoserine O-acetyltransferase [Grifola frondosa]|uniref:Homoserine O-acetyltransferase n=1 Tax=Grifola frondosa TaxID=5627 RepID=A0A1C7M7C1_GRIFR|nr:Homoserine O-acetyltransferase [Grifola frondosa]
METEHLTCLGPEIQYYHHGRFSVTGGVLPDAVTAYRTYGDPNNPCIVFPTCYGGRLDSQDYMIGPDKALDPTKYYIVTFALFSNGEAAPYNGPYFPAVSYEDNIRAQYAVLTNKLEVQKVVAAIGFSMGGQQAYYWPVMYPHYVEKFISICGSARTSPHNKCFLEGPKAALVNSKDFDGGHYATSPQLGSAIMATSWAGGTPLDDFLRAEWEGGFVTTWDANDLLTLLNTWQTGDISTVGGVNPNGSDVDTAFANSLEGIKAKGLIMPCKTDLYFPPEDSEIEMSHMKNGSRLAIINSVWGHLAGAEVTLRTMRSSRPKLGSSWRRIDRIE